MPALNPAQYVVKIFGGVRATARAIKRYPGTVSKWNKPKRKGGCGGNVPGEAARSILKIAERKGLDITARDLIVGRIVPA